MRTGAKVALGFAGLAIMSVVWMFGAVTGYAVGTSSNPGHVTPPNCDGRGTASYCVVDLPDCRELVFTSDGGIVTWYQQNWCKGQSRVN